MVRQVAWEQYDEQEMQKVFAFAEDYKRFLDKGKTERECAAEAAAQAEALGFCSLDSVIREGRKLQAGDRVYCNWMGKSFMAFIIGEKPLEEGMNILGAHIDSPRLDVKQNPLYEEEGIAYFDTHYYGGIKKYQWVTLPLALHGVIVRRDGSKVTVAIGENADDPVFYISDLLVHLSQEQLAKKASVAVEGE